MIREEIQLKLNEADDLKEKLSVFEDAKFTSKISLLRGRLIRKLESIKSDLSKLDNPSPEESKLLDNINTNISQELFKHKRQLKERYDTELLHGEAKVPDVVTTFPKGIAIQARKVATSMSQIKNATTAKARVNAWCEFAKDTGLLVATPVIFATKFLIEHWYLLLLLWGWEKNKRKRKPKTKPDEQEKERVPQEQQQPVEVPEETPEKVPEELPNDVYDGKPEEAPGEIPESTPAEVPEEIPAEIPEEVPAEVPEEIPKEVPEETPGEMPREVPEEIPGKKLKKLPKHVREDEPHIAPEEAPSEVPAEVPKEVPKELPDELPNDVPAEVPNDVPAEVPEEVPAEVPEEIPAELPDEVPNDVPAEVPEEVPAEVPEEVPSELPDELPNDVPAEVPDEIPAELPDEAPEGMPDGGQSDVPPETPEKKPIHLPKGVPDDEPHVAPEEPVEVPEEVPTEIPEEVPAEVPEEVPDELPNDVPQEEPNKPDVPPLFDPNEQTPGDGGESSGSPDETPVETPDEEPGKIIQFPEPEPQEEPVPGEEPAPGEEEPGKIIQFPGQEPQEEPKAAIVPEGEQEPVVVTDAVVPEVASEPAVAVEIPGLNQEQAQVFGAANDGFVTEAESDFVSGVERYGYYIADRHPNANVIHSAEEYKAQAIEQAGGFDYFSSQYAMTPEQDYWSIPSLVRPQDKILIWPDQEVAKGTIKAWFNTEAEFLQYIASGQDPALTRSYVEYIQNNCKMDYLYSWARDIPAFQDMCAEYHLDVVPALTILAIYAYLGMEPPADAMATVQNVFSTGAMQAVPVF